MILDNTLKLTAETENDMRRIGVKVGESLFPGAFIAFFGGLGAGKTTMTKGIAEALGIDDILSPTFTIVRHHEGKLTLDHFDAYRIEDPDELYAIGFDDYVFAGGVVIMEWCENVPEVLPERRLEIHIEGSGSDPRHIEFCAIGEEYLSILEGVCK